MSIELMKAAKAGDLDKVVDLILNHNVDVNAKVHFLCLGYNFQMQSTALHQAAQNLHLNIVAYLIQKGANVNITISSHGFYNWTPLHAVAYNNPHKQLSPNEMMFAHAVANVLMQAGADQNIRMTSNFQPNNKGKTPIDIAKEGGSYSVVDAIEAFDRKDLNAKPTKAYTASYSDNGNIFSRLTLAIEDPEESKPKNDVTEIHAPTVEASKTVPLVENYQASLLHTKIEKNVLEPIFISTIASETADPKLKEANHFYWLAKSSASSSEAKVLFGQAKDMYKLFSPKSDTIEHEFKEKRLGKIRLKLGGSTN